MIPLSGQSVPVHHQQPDAEALKLFLSVCPSEGGGDEDDEGDILLWTRTLSAFNFHVHGISGGLLLLANTTTEEEFLLWTITGGQMDGRMVPLLQE